MCVCANRVAHIDFYKGQTKVENNITKYASTWYMNEPNLLRGHVQTTWKGEGIKIP